MFSSKTIKCRVFEPTKLKYQALKQEYDNLQKFLELERIGADWIAENIPLHSANKQQSLRYYKKIKSDKRYPISIRKDQIILKKTKHKFCKYWVRIPVKQRRGGLWLPIKPHCKFPKDYKLCESKIFKKDNNFEIHIVVKKTN
ncbi:MAG: hypothetical protein ABIE55_00455 [Candidatus Aenigmatarchaeota archaeon]